MPLLTIFTHKLVILSDERRQNDDCRFCELTGILISNLIHCYTLHTDRNQNLSFECFRIRIQILAHLSRLLEFPKQQQKKINQITQNIEIFYA